MIEWSPILAVLIVGAETVRFDPPQPALGDPVIAYLATMDFSPSAGEVHAFGYATSLQRVSDHVLRAAIAVPDDVDPGPYEVRFVLGERTVLATLHVGPREFDESELRVSRRFTRKPNRELSERLSTEHDEIAAVWAAEPTSPVAFGAIVRPVPGEVTGRFGTRRIFNGRTKSVHYGLDLDGRTGAPIVAVAAGKVVLSSMRWGSGGTIILDHGGGLFTLYFHMSSQKKRVGEVVKAGEVLGAVGRTGRVTGPHLHLAVVVRSVRLEGPKKGEARSMYADPETFLGLRLGP